MEVKKSLLPRKEWQIILCWSFIGNLLVSTHGYPRLGLNLKILINRHNNLWYKSGHQEEVVKPIIDPVFMLKYHMSGKISQLPYYLEPWAVIVISK